MRRPGCIERSPSSLGLRREDSLPYQQPLRADSDPQIGVWGVGYLPRSLQSKYAVGRRPDIGSYRVVMRSGWELERLFRQTGYRDIRVRTAGLHAPHVNNRVLHVAMKVYNRLRVLPGLRLPLTWLGPHLSVTAIRRQA